MSAKREHWLIFDLGRIVGCHCGFKADIDADVGYGDSVVAHLLAEAWDEGEQAGIKNQVNWDGWRMTAPEMTNPYNKEEAK